MNIILDTHVFLWFITGDKQLDETAIKHIVNPRNNCFVSIASIWEIAIKISIDKLDIKGGFGTIENFLENNDVEIMPITFEHTKTLLTLPHYHNDPFDRIVISQSISEDFPIISKDRYFKDYGITLL